MLIREVGRSVGRGRGYEFARRSQPDLVFGKFLFWVRKAFELVFFVVPHFPNFLLTPICEGRKEALGMNPR